MSYSLLFPTGAFLATAEYSHVGILPTDFSHLGVFSVDNFLPSFHKVVICRYLSL